MRTTASGMLLLLLLPLSSVEAQDSKTGSAHLLVMLEVPGSAPTAELVIADMVLRHGQSAETLELLNHTWITHERAVGQTRIVDQSVASGELNTLEISIASIVAPAGAAAVRPPVPEDPLRIPLDRHLRPGEAGLVVLRWTPSWVEDDSTAYEVRIEAVTPQVPPVGSLAFVSSEGSDLICVVDTEELDVVDVIGAGRGPRDLVYSAREQKVYCALAASGELMAIDVLSRQLASQVQTRFGDEPSRLVLDRDGSTLYVLNFGSNSVGAYGSYSLREKFRIDVGQESRALAYDEFSGFLYVASEITSEVLVYDPNAQREVARFSLDAQPAELEINSLDQRLYVGTEGRRRILVLDPRSGAELSRLEICDSAAQLIWLAASRRLYAPMPACREVGISLPEEALEMGSIRLDDRPGRMAFEPGLRRAFVTLPDAAALAVCNLGSRRVDAVLEVGRKPYGVVIP